MGLEALRPGMGLLHLLERWGRFESLGVAATSDGKRAVESSKKAKGKDKEKDLHGPKKRPARCRCLRPIFVVIVAAACVPTRGVRWW
jgi:hypothetical protein